MSTTPSGSGSTSAVAGKETNGVGAYTDKNNKSCSSPIKFVYKAMAIGKDLPSQGPPISRGFAACA